LNFSRLSYQFIETAEPGIFTIFNQSMWRIACGIPKTVKRQGLRSNTQVLVFPLVAGAGFPAFCGTVSRCCRLLQILFVGH